MKTGKFTNGIYSPHLQGHFKVSQGYTYLNLGLYVCARVYVRKCVSREQVMNNFL